MWERSYALVSCTAVELCRGVWAERDSCNFSGQTYLWFIYKAAMPLGMAVDPESPVLRPNAVRSCPSEEALVSELLQSMAIASPKSYYGFLFSKPKCSQQKR